MPVPRINLAQFVNPGNPSPMMDITAGYRQWQQQHLNEAQLAENQRQFDANQAQQDYQFGQNMGQQRRVSDDINSRFAIEQGGQLDSRRYEVESNRFKQQQMLLQKARAAAADGRWNEVESMMGTLKSLGANVGRTIDSEGRPSYMLQEGEAPAVTGETYQSIQDKINQGRNPFASRLGQQVINLNQPEPAATQTAPNPQTETQQSEPALSPADAADQAFLSDSFGADATETSTAPTQQVQSQQTSNYNPYQLNSGELNQMNQLRLDPMLEGLRGSVPYRYQGNAESLFGGIRALGASPESTLQMLQKPFDTASRTWNAEMGAEGQMAKAGIAASGQASTEARMRENEAVRRAEQRAKDVGLRQAIDDNLEYDEIGNKINARGNPSAQADAVKHLISLREGNRITDQDFKIGLMGVASDIQQLKERVEHFYVNGLSETQIANFNGMLRLMKSANQKRIKAGFNKLKQYTNAFRYEPERYGVYNYIRGAIPPDAWDDEMKTWDPSMSLGGETPRQQSGQRKSVNVTAPTTQEAVDGASELDQFD